MTDGAFIGSWYHWPPLEGGEFEYLVNKNWDAIYISHFHADHFDRNLLSAIARNQSEIKVIIPDYSNKWLKRAVLNCGIIPQNLVELPSNKILSIKDIDVKMYVADYCNPQICGVSVSCQSKPRNQTANDSLALFEADGQRVLNANDALAIASVVKIYPLIGEIDLLLGHFGGAGPYPQCFSDLSEIQKKEAAAKNGWVFVNRLIQAAEKLNAKFTLPYAGQYVLGGNLSDLNSYRSVIPMHQVLEKVQASGVTNAVSIMPFEEFNLTLETFGGMWMEPSSEVLSSYLNRISKISFPYQRKIEDWPDGSDQFMGALKQVEHNFDVFLKNGGKGSNSSITIKAEEIQGTLNFGEKNVSISESNMYENHTVIEMDQRLLKRIVIRKSGYSGFTPFHFNQAEIGSHMIWRRQGPYPTETQFLNYMHHYLK
jgi:UDP-MurNAc hydroxylase